MKAERKGPAGNSCEVTLQLRLMFVVVVQSKWRVVMKQYKLSCTLNPPQLIVENNSFHTWNNLHVFII